MTGPILGIIGVMILFFVGSIVYVTLLPAPIQLTQEESQKIVKSIVYVKDPKTGLCYAVAWKRLTLVPCEKVGDSVGK
jgi:hypothetical protein